MKEYSKQKKLRILSIDPQLKPYEESIRMRMAHYEQTRKALLGDSDDLLAFANGHMYYGVHRTETGWVVREHAPGADSICLFGDFNGWNRTSHPMTKVGGDFELILEGHDALQPGQKLLLSITSNGQNFDRVPAYMRYAVQNPATNEYEGCVVNENSYEWHDQKRAKTPPSPLLIYECHVGMGQEKDGIGTYEEFAEKVLPRIKEDGYNAIQLMAIQEHSYYASFGYHITSPFAASSRYGDPNDLKKMIDKAHNMGIRVLLDIVHSHASSNERDGIAAFDGSGSLYCQGDHPAWGSRLFCYGRHDVLHYLLSNVKFWMDEYHFDGFRFDGVTSMLYHDHAMGKAFTSYDDYFGMNVNFDATTYLMLAAELIHTVNPGAIAIVEDMSAMPGMCLPISWGGFGFNYRLNMGVPDIWIKLIKEYRDEDWDLGKLWYELTIRRPSEKTIGYSESHDQALVGDQTIIFRLLGAEMYTGMNKDYHSLTMDRGIALSKLIRFVTLVLGCDGYLNFMGNEFGHPEWIDFPREGNGWSYHYARRQWSLADNGFLKFQQLGDFDKAMISLVKKQKVLSDKNAQCIDINHEKKVMLFKRGGLVFVFNFGSESMDGYELFGLPLGQYKAVLDSDREKFGGFGRVSSDYVYQTDEDGKFKIYLPERTAIVLEQI
ncbi:MAG: alpha amylase C-terminal domain-containing protein [Clostridia bacterium]|nr:alpha amylase C-terminal domain-containing protein [Clostridia bacterium]